MWRLYSFVILLIASSICILPLPSRCNIIRSNKIHFPHKTHMATKSNATKIESSVDRIRELGNVSTSNLTIPARGYICAIYLGAMSLKKANLSLFFATLQSLTACPFAVKENKLDNRIPSMFYELECLHCNKCGKQGSKCTQLVTEMEVVFWKVG